MKPIRVAIVGCGRISDLHQLGYKGRTDAQITAVCDTKKSHAKKKAKAWGVNKIYTDYQQVLADPEIDLVELFNSPSPALQDDGRGLYCRKACLCAKTDGTFSSRSG